MVCLLVCLWGFLKVELDCVPGMLPCLKGTGVRLCIFQNTSKTAVKLVLFCVFLVDAVYDSSKNGKFLL